MQCFCTMYSDFPVVLLFSVSVYPFVFLLFPTADSLYIFQFQFLTKSGWPSNYHHLFTGFCTRPHDRSQASLGIGYVCASPSYGLNIASPSGMTAQGSFLQWGSFSERDCESCTMAAINTVFSENAHGLDTSCPICFNMT